jgi:hypothetical protein
MDLSSIINWELLRHPYNWVIVILMLGIGYGILMLLQKPLSELPTGTLSAI